MRWLFRPVTTLAVGPILFVLVAVYIQAATQADALAWPVVAQQLRQIYLSFSLPALALVLAVLLPVDLVLRRTGFGLATVVVSPILAVALMSLLRDAVSEPHVQAWSSLWLAARLRPRLGPHDPRSRDGDGGVSRTFPRPTMGCLRG